MEKVKVKGYNNGLLVLFENGISYEEALGAVKEKFTQSRKFFGSSLMSVRFQGIDLTVDQEMELCDAITGSCDIKIACVLEDDEEKDSTFASAIRIVDDILDQNDLLYYRGTVKDGQVLRSSKDIVVIGDVNPGCSIISSGNIYIFGGLYGEAYAGTSEKISKADESKIVMALEMSPEELYIGTVKYNLEKKSFWGNRIKLAPSVAYTENKRVVVSPYSKELMDRLNDRISR